MARTIFILCKACAEALEPDTEIIKDGQIWDGQFALRCHGHEGGEIRAGEEFWVAGRHLDGDLGAPLDALFDADLVHRNDERAPVDRFDWLIQDGILVHAPATWTWSCPECGLTGEMSTDLLADVHGVQHAGSTFGRVVPLDVGLVRSIEP